MKNRTVAKLITASFVAGAITTYVVMYEWHQQTLKFIGVAYKIAHEEIQELKGEIGE